jgi:hypothetical protein
MTVNMMLLCIALASDLPGREQGFLAHDIKVDAKMPLIVVIGDVHQRDLIAIMINITGTILIPSLTLSLPFSGHLCIYSPR